MFFFGVATNEAKFVYTMSDHFTTTKKKTFGKHDQRHNGKGFDCEGDDTEW